jgi:hypothetical protein
MITSKFKSGDYVTDKCGKTTIVTDGFFMHYSAMGSLDDRAKFWRIATKEEIEQLYKQKADWTELNKLLEEKIVVGVDYIQTNEPKFKIGDYVTDRYRKTGKVIDVKIYNNTKYGLDGAEDWRLSTEEEIACYKEQEFEKELDHLCYRQEIATEHMLYYQQEVAFYAREQELLLLARAEEKNNGPSGPSGPNGPSQLL